MNSSNLSTYFSTPFSCSSLLNSSATSKPHTPSALKNNSLQLIRSLSPNKNPSNQNSAFFKVKRSNLHLLMHKCTVHRSWWIFYISFTPLNFDHKKWVVLLLLRPHCRLLSLDAHISPHDCGFFVEGLIPLELELSLSSSLLVTIVFRMFFQCP